MYAGRQSAIHYRADVDQEADLMSALIGADLSLVREPERGRIWLALRRPFAMLPPAAALDELGLDGAGLIERVKAHVADRRRDQAEVAPQFREKFDVPYALELSADGSYLALWEACGRTWEEIVAGIREAA